MTRRAALALIAAGALLLWLAQGPIWAFLRAGGAPIDQRPLAGGSSDARAARGPVRVLLLDGLSRADASRLPALARVCARGAVLTVDVGFPTKSLPAQFALWTGLTPQQGGLSFDNDPIATPPHAIPAQVPGSIAVVENTRAIAGSFGFARVLPDDGADADLPAHDPARAAAWHDRDFARAALDATASAAPLVLVHVLAIDDAAHEVGRAAPAYDRALAYADAIVDQVAAAAPPDAALLVLADHGHIARGGHGDAEDDTRSVRACVTIPGAARGAGSARGAASTPPLVAAPSGDARSGAVHLIDLARWLADRTGATLAPEARGRPLAAAIAHPDRDATLPTPGAARWAIALAALIAIAALAWRMGASAWSLAWPLAALAIAALVPGLPTLSNRPRLAIAWLATAAPITALAALLGARRVRPRTIVVACVAPALALAIAAAILAGVPAAAMGGPPARVPWWTGELTFWLAQTAAALGAAGLAGLVRRPDTTPALRRGPPPDVRAPDVPVRPADTPCAGAHPSSEGPALTPAW